MILQIIVILTYISEDDEDDVQEGTSNEKEDYDPDDLENILNKKESDDYLGIGKLKIPSTYKFYTIVANVFMSRYLVSGDCNGMRDPYCVVRILDKEIKTSVK